MFFFFLKKRQLLRSSRTLCLPIARETRDLSTRLNTARYSCSAQTVRVYPPSQYLCTNFTMCGIMMTHPDFYRNQTGKETTGQVYTGIADAVTTIVKTEGLATLWSGFAPILTRKVIWCTVFFVSYERLLEL